MFPRCAFRRCERLLKDQSGIARLLQTCVTRGDRRIRHSRDNHTGSIVALVIFVQYAAYYNA